MSFLIAKCGTFIASRTVSLNAWTSRKAKRARAQPHQQHFPDTDMREDRPLLPERGRHAGISDSRPLRLRSGQALAKNARTGHPRVWFRKEDQNCRKGRPPASDSKS